MILCQIQGMAWRRVAFAPLEPLQLSIKLATGEAIGMKRRLGESATLSIVKNII